MNANVKGAFLSDLESLRTRARDQIMKGAVTPSFPEADRQAIVGLLNTALATDPDLNPATLLSRSHAEYEETSLRKMLAADLGAERIAIESFIGPREPTSRRLRDLLEDVPKD